jgi:hypothetical protein
MADDKETRRWVGDQLINLLGYNNPTTVSFVIGLGTFSFLFDEVIESRAHVSNWNDCS